MLPGEICSASGSRFRALEAERYRRRAVSKRTVGRVGELVRAVFDTHIPIDHPYGIKAAKPEPARYQDPIPTLTPNRVVEKSADAVCARLTLRAETLNSV